MSEKRVEAIEFEPILISAALESWQQAEIEWSMSAEDSNNKELDNWPKFWVNAGMAFDDDFNQDAQKTISHHSRLISFIGDLMRYPDFAQNDAFMARQLFCAQMCVSGAYRRQCFLQAADEADYIRRRTQQGPVGIRLQEAVSDRLAEHSTGSAAQEFDYSDTPLHRLVSTTLERNDESLEVAQIVHERAVIDRGQEDSPAVHLLEGEQTKWSRLAVDYIVFMATQKNSLRGVPFLEPKSITRQSGELQYPFDAAFKGWG